MKTFRVKSEIPQIILVLLPFLYLAWIWGDLPSQVPLHWNIHGEVDRYGNKQELILIPLLLPFLTYVVMWIIPFIDPKDKIKNMGRKYDTLKFILVGFMSLLALTILYITEHKTLLELKYITLLVGILFMIMGNYFKTIRPNYFIGIRTPWTLENEVVWKKTHRLAGPLWLTGGFIVLLISLFLSNKVMMIGMLVVTSVIVLIPIFYSYLLFHKLKKVDIEEHVPLE